MKRTRRRRKSEREARREEGGGGGVMTKERKQKEEKRRGKTAGKEGEGERERRTSEITKFLTQLRRDGSSLLLLLKGSQ